MSESKNESNQSVERSRVQSIYLERVYNLGNYENIKVGVRVDIAREDDPGLVLASLERIFNDLRASGSGSSFDLSRAQRIVSTPEGDLDEHDKRRLEQSREVVRSQEEAKERRRKARQALASLNYTSEYKDHKEDWQDDGFDVEI
jgi:hypothetical protein